MDFLFVLGRQPLFRLIAAVIVLLVVDAHPVWGVAVALVWIAWVWASRQHQQRGRF